MEDAIRFLNTLNLDEFLERGRQIYDVMDEIEAIYGSQYAKQTGNDFLFDDMSQDDFADYIRKEYGIKCYEESILFIK